MDTMEIQVLLHTTFMWSFSEVTKMKTKIFTHIASILALLILIIFASVGVYAAIDPSKPQATSIDSNTTNAYPNGTVLNNTRGFVYSMTLNESQPSIKWVGYVGNVNGEYALQDSSGNAFYDWSIVTITGEIYATKEGPYTTERDDQNKFSGGIPYWANLSCAVHYMLKNETLMLNHTTTATLDNPVEDTYLKTFVDTGFSNPGFYAGEKQVTDITMFDATSSNCYGANLNQNNADQTNNWTMIILTDGTSQYKDVSATQVNYDIIYGALLENNTVGYNGNTYDFQIMLPQSGLEGTQPNVAYYLYVELI